MDQFEFNKELVQAVLCLAATIIETAPKETEVQKEALTRNIEEYLVHMKKAVGAMNNGD